MAGRKTLRMSIALVAALALAASAASEAGMLWGARAAKADADRDVEDMLSYAIQDEYLARAEYLAIMRKHGEIRPFSNIAKSEESHIAWLKEAYASRGLKVPADWAETFVIVPASLEESFRAGVAAEIDNIAMYESFISSKLMGAPENAALKALFERLRDASKNHLAAFQSGLGQY